MNLQLFSGLRYFNLHTHNIKEVTYKVIVMIAFISMVFLCTYWFIESALETIDGVSNGLDKIVFDKGAFYLLGAAIGLVDLIWIMTYQGILKKALDSKVTLIFSRVAAVSLVVAFSLPVVCLYSLSRRYSIWIMKSVRQKVILGFTFQK